MKNKEILTAWLKYIQVEDLEAVTIDQKEIEQRHHVDLEIKVHNGNFYPECVLKPTMLDEIIESYKKSDSNEYFWFFPLILRYKDGKNYLQPLFAISMNKCIDVKSKSITSEKAFEASNDVIPILPVLQYLGVESEDIPSNLSFIDLIAHIVNKKHFTDLKVALQELKDFIEKSPNSQEIKFSDGIVIQLQPNIFSKKLKEDHKYLIDKGITKKSLLETYLNNKSKYELKPLRDLDSNIFWYGAFDKYPLGKGQAVVMQRYVRNDPIIAVQGGPGTGKTTLILSIIANTIVKRAYSLSNNGTDFNNLMLIVSTSNKAVENVAERFMTDSLFKTRNDFYFIAGNQDNKSKSSERINKYLNELKNSTYDEKLAKKSKEAFLELYSHLEEESEKYLKEQKKAEALKKVLSILEIDLESTKNGKKDIEQSLENLCIIFKDYPSEYDYTSWDELDKKFAELELLRQRKIDKTYIQELENELTHRADKATQYHNLVSDFQTKYDLTNYHVIKYLENTVFEEADKLRLSIDNLSFLEKIFEFVLKKRKGLCDFFNKQHEDTLQLFSLQPLSSENVHSIIGSLNAIKQKILTIQKHLPNDILYLNKDWTTYHESQKEAVKHINNIYNHIIKKASLSNDMEQLNNKVQILYKKIIETESEIKKNSDHLKNMITNAADAYRLKNQEENDQLFKLAMDVMKHEVLKNKDQIISALDDFKIQLSEWNKDIFGRWSNDLSNFAKYISMVYPVVTSTMASSASLFMFYPNNFEKHKPVYMVLSDESGMATPHQLLPALYRAERAIVVGDPKQLPPIVPLTESTINSYENEAFGDDVDSSQRYSPVSISAYHRAAGCKSGHYDDIGDGILLDEHRRCQEDIAKLFIKIADYDGLQIKTPSIFEKNVSDIERFKAFGNKQLYFVAAKGSKGPSKNTNLDEVKSIENIINELERCGYNPKKDIGLITPYSNQSKLLTQEFGQRLGHTQKEQKIGTVHAFQGAEYEVMIFSPVVHTKDDNSVFIEKSPNLLNVAISRAKQIFIMVGNTEKMKSGSGNLKKIYDASTFKQ